jgi:hypothetical protein
MIVRNDLLPSNTVIPKELKETILRVGGKTPFGEPMYRLILAECRTVKAAGLWNIWGAVPVSDRGSLGIKEAQELIRQGQLKLDEMMENGDSVSDLINAAKKQREEVQELIASKMAAHPEKVIRGMVDRPLYAFTGFVLEKWKPAESFGTPVEWYSFRFEGEAALGPYPTYGDYELVAGPTPYMPTSAQIEEAIRHEFHVLENRPRSTQARMSQILAQVEAAQAADEREQFNKIEAMCKETMPLFRTLSLGAGRVRQELADKAGLKGNFGN